MRQHINDQPIGSVPKLIAQVEERAPKHFEIIHIKTGRPLDGLFSIRSDGKVFKEVCVPYPGYPELYGMATEEVDMDEHEINWRKK